MWNLDYNEEVKHYFFDNEPYTFPLLVRIEELKFEPDGVPPEGCTPMEDEPNTFLWVVLEHIVVYEKRVEENTLRILIVKMLDTE